MKILFWEIKKVEKEPDVVDENGKVVNKPTWKEKAGKVAGAVASIVTVGGAAGLGYALAKRNVGMEKDKKIQDLKECNNKLFLDNLDLYNQLHPEAAEEADEDEVEVV